MEEAGQPAFERGGVPGSGTAILLGPLRFVAYNHQIGIVNPRFGDLRPKPISKHQNAHGSTRFQETT